MKVRLAFSVAAHLDPEILIVDEVLAVGDAEFQSKCLGKMRGVAGSGRTVLFVSHNMGAVQNLCRRAVALRDGKLVDDGPSADVVRRYLAGMREKRRDAFSVSHPERKNTGVFKFTSGWVTDLDGQPTDNIISGEPMAFRLGYESEEDLRDIEFVVKVRNESGVTVTTIATKLTDFRISATGRRGQVTCTLPKNPFALGDYHVAVVARWQGERIDAVPTALHFTVTDSIYFGTSRTPPRGRSAVYVEHHWAIEAEEHSGSQEPARRRR